MTRTTHQACNAHVRHNAAGLRLKRPCTAAGLAACAWADAVPLRCAPQTTHLRRDAAGPQLPPRLLRIRSRGVHRLVAGRHKGRFLRILHCRLVEVDLVLARCVVLRGQASGRHKREQTSLSHVCVVSKAYPCLGDLHASEAGCTSSTARANTSCLQACWHAKRVDRACAHLITTTVGLSRRAARRNRGVRARQPAAEPTALARRVVRRAAARRLRHRPLRRQRRRLGIMILHQPPAAPPGRGLRQRCL